MDKTSVSCWASVKLTAIGEDCRAMLLENVSTMIGCALAEQLESKVKVERNTAQHLRNLLLSLDLAPVQ